VLPTHTSISSREDLVLHDVRLDERAAVVRRVRPSCHAERLPIMVVVERFNLHRTETPGKAATEAPRSASGCQRARVGAERGGTHPRRGRRHAGTALRRHARRSSRSTPASPASGGDRPWKSSAGGMRNGSWTRTSSSPPGPARRVERSSAPPRWPPATSPETASERHPVVIDRQPHRSRPSSPRFECCGCLRHRPGARSGGRHPAIRASAPYRRPEPSAPDQKAEP
jgi:hypothetical protein